MEKRGRGKRRKVIGPFESNELYHRLDYNGEGAACIIRIPVIRASVTKYNRTLELSTPGIPFTLYDNWDARRESGLTCSPSPRRRESNDVSRRAKAKEEKEETRENFIVVARVTDRTTVARLSSTRVRPRFFLFFFFSFEFLE